MYVYISNNVCDAQIGAAFVVLAIRQQSAELSLKLICNSTILVLVWRLFYAVRTGYLNRYIIRTYLAAMHLIA